MFTLVSCPVELRGVANKTSKTGKTYYVLNVETDEGQPFSLYCPDFNALPSGLVKGDKVLVSFTYSNFRNQEKLTVIQVSKA